MIGRQIGPIVQGERFGIDRPGAGASEQATKPEQDTFDL
jgi:hypothetical protein